MTSQVIEVKAAETVGTGTLTLWNETDGTWNSEFSVPCYVGREGVTLRKSEGDGATPAGVYPLGQVFGVAPDPGSAQQYLQLTDDYYWVDDCDSPYYNQLADISKTGLQWKSAEHLIEVTPYEYAVVVRYNPDCIRGAGSGIFLHCEAGKPTAGCISVDRDSLVTILQTLKSDSMIFIH